MSIVYTESSPGPELADRVACFWTIRSHAPLTAARLNRVVPDNCSDIIFDLGDGVLRNRRLPGRQRSYAVGAMRRPLAVGMEGTVHLLGIRFRPGCGREFLQIPANELTDAIVPLDDLWGSAGREAEAIIAEVEPARRAGVLASLLLARRGVGLERPPAVTHALRRIDGSRGGIRVRALHEALGLGRRQLERLFAESVGVSPKTACRVARFRATQRRLLDQPDASLARIAFACGYADQPHLTREFKELAGIPPAAYRRERADVASVQDEPAGSR